MTQEEFVMQNPCICTPDSNVKNINIDKLLTQGAFLSARTFIFDTLDEIEAGVLRLRYGVDNQNPMKYDEIAERLEVQLKMVKETELRAERKLRHPSRVRLLKEYTDETIDKSLLERFTTPKIL